MGETTSCTACHSGDLVNASGGHTCQPAQVEEPLSRPVEYRPADLRVGFIPLAARAAAADEFGRRLAEKLSTPDDTTWLGVAAQMADALGLGADENLVDGAKRVVRERDEARTGAVAIPSHVLLDHVLLDDEDAAALNMPRGTSIEIAVLARLAARVMPERDKAICERDAARADAKALRDKLARIQEAIEP